MNTSDILNRTDYVKQHTDAGEWMLIKNPFKQRCEKCREWVYEGNHVLWNGKRSREAAVMCAGDCLTFVREREAESEANRLIIENLKKEREIQKM